MATMKPISEYCNQEVAGWEQLPFEMFLFPPEEKPYFCSFLNREQAIQIMCSMRGDWLHVSLAPVPSIKPGSVESEIIENIAKHWEGIVGAFFGDLRFSKAPDTPAKHNVKHYVYYLGQNFSDN